MTNLYLSAVMIIGVSLNSLAPSNDQNNSLSDTSDCSQPECVIKANLDSHENPNELEPLVETEIANTHF